MKQKQKKPYCSICGYDIGKNDTKAKNPEICKICENSLSYNVLPADLMMAADRSRNRVVEAFLAETHLKEGKGGLTC